MKYTGIRAVPYSTPRRIMQPHLARYEFAIQTVGCVNKALDIACGTGYGASILKMGGIRNILGADLDWSAVYYAKENCPDENGISFTQADGNVLPISDEAVDLITCFETFEHILDSHSFLAELNRILKPEGTLVISIPNAPIWAPFKRSPNLNVDYIRLGLGHKYNLTPKELTSLLSDYFEVVVLYGQDFRRVAFTSKIIRQLERGVIYLKYRISENGYLRQMLGSLLKDVLPQNDLVFEDTNWAVRRWDKQDYEPLFCVALCREKKEKSD
jgi:ubiquinone/menaquinone biosynthesis C-methylase UbiE